VGLDLYTQLLQEEIARLKGQPAKEVTRFPSIDISIRAFLPADYLPSDELRILFYRKLVVAETPDALDAVQQELEDRFGALPEEAQTLMQASRLRMIARDLGISAVIQKPSSLDIQFLENTPVLPQTVIGMANERSHLRFRPGPPFTLISQAIAYESLGPITYLERLFQDLRRTSPPVGAP
jgi:transcription-repair coupling factor (superfamily II helicase)